MTSEITPYVRFDPNRRDRSLWHQPHRKEGAPELYQCCEGVLGYSNVIDLEEPLTIIVHPSVSDIDRYKPFIEKHKGLIVVLEEDHELARTLWHFDSLKRFQNPPLARLRNTFRSKSNQVGPRLDNFIYVPTDNNDPIPMWGITDYERYHPAFRERVDELEKTSWPRFAQFVQSLRMGQNPNFQIRNYNPSIQTQPVRLAGGYWPSGCAGATKAELEYRGIKVEPIEGLMYVTV